ncbi:hypothetical protein [Listeria booriae]|uniref:hypothetical protein n=1 Tax=Listeria booriae TaxID=1552123 RepID=UPI0016268C6F|nr:hypothetical protein [Listeria booriae]MBC2258906.1 hypothetical protein [Listeria booriae]
MESRNSETKDEELSGKRKVIKIDVENIDLDPNADLQKINIDTVIKMFSNLAQQHKRIYKVISDYGINSLININTREAVDSFLNNVTSIPDISRKQTVLSLKKMSDISKSIANVAIQNIESFSRLLTGVQYFDIFKQFDITDITKDKLNTFSSELITVSEDFPLDISVSERGELISFLELSLDKLTKFEAESYVLHPHQYFLTDKIIKAYRSNNYFYIPFIGFSLIDSLFKDVLQTIKETQSKLANSWVKKQDRGKSALAYNSIYNIDFNFNEIHQVEIYSLLGVYEKLYANYKDNYSGNLNRNAVMHGDWVDVERMGKYDALRIMQFIVVLEKNIDIIQKIFQNHVKNQLLFE